MDENSVDIKKSYAEFYGLFATGSLIFDKKTLDILTNFVKARATELGLADTKVNVLYKHSRIYKDEKGNIKSQIIVYDPITKKKYGDWNKNTAGYFSPAENAIYCPITVADTISENEDYSVKSDPELNIYRHRESLIRFLMTVEHEFRHAVQQRDYNNGVINYSSLQYGKDCLIMNYHVNGKKEKSRAFYNMGHDGFYIENDANEHATAYAKEQVRQRDLSRFIVCPKTKIADYDYIIDQAAKEERKNNEQKVKYTLEGHLIGSNSMGTDEVQDQPEKIISLLVDGIVKDEKDTIFMRYPIFRYIYNEDGSKKTYQELMEESKEHPELKTFYEDVIKNDSILRLQKLEDTIIKGYLKSKKEDKDRILTDGLKLVYELATKENMNLENIITYLDKRIDEISKMDENELSKEDKTTAKLLFFIIKQAIYENENIKRLKQRTLINKNVIPNCQLYLKEKFNINFNDDSNKIIVELRKIVGQISSGKIPDTIRNEKELVKAKDAISKCLDFYMGTGSDYYYKMKVKKNDYSNLYGTNHYRKIFNANYYILDEFEFANELYKECSKYVGLSIDELEDNPIISRLCVPSSPIFTRLTIILNEETDDEYIDRLHDVIDVCKMYRTKNIKAGVKK